jgi:hypothetical protein
MRGGYFGSLAYFALVVVGCKGAKTTPISTTHAPAPTHSSYATWPWPNSKESLVTTGLTRWHVPSTEDGTSLELFRIVLHANSPLSIGIADLDENDPHPFDNKADYYDKDVPFFVNNVNTSTLPGSVRALFNGRAALVWNGPFFTHAATPEFPKHGWASHIGPVVLKGKKHYNVGSHRWTFGWQQVEGGNPVFKTLHKPSWQTLEDEFFFAADGLQCLVREGKPLNLPPPTDPKFSRPRGGVKSTPQDVGAIPIVDDIKTSRTSIGWSQDNTYLYVLIVSEPDTEAGSINAFRRGEKQVGGWNLADLQEFWLKLGVWGAVNSDGGMQTQRAYVLRDNVYDFLMPQIKGPSKTVQVTPGDKKISSLNAGGTLMAFYVFERMRHPHD